METQRTLTKNVEAWKPTPLEVEKGRDSGHGIPDYRNLTSVELGNGGGRILECSPHGAQVVVPLTHILPFVLIVLSVDFTMTLLLQPALLATRLRLLLHSLFCLPNLLIFLTGELCSSCFTVIFPIRRMPGLPVLLLLRCCCSFSAAVSASSSATTAPKPTHTHTRSTPLHRHSHVGLSTLGFRVTRMRIVFLSPDAINRTLDSLLDSKIFQFNYSPNDEQVALLCSKPAQKRTNTQYQCCQTAILVRFLCRRF